MPKNIGSIKTWSAKIIMSTLLFFLLQVMVCGWWLVDFDPSWVFCDCNNDWRQRKTQLWRQLLNLRVLMFVKSVVKVICFKNLIPFADVMLGSQAMKYVNRGQARMLSWRREKHSKWYHHWNTLLCGCFSNNRKISELVSYFTFTCFLKTNETFQLWYYL